MNYRIVKLVDFPSDESSLYSVIEGDDEITLFQKFIEENIEDHRKEVNNIIERLVVIGKYEGARENYFKINEGKPGDGVCALYDDEEKKLRLYCIRYGKVALILGGGGVKNNKYGTAWQDDTKLKSEVKKVIKISNDIMTRQRDGEIYWINDGKDLEGDLIFN